MQVQSAQEAYQQAAGIDQTPWIAEKDQIQKQLEIHGKLEMIRSNCKKTRGRLEEQGSTDPAGKTYQRKRWQKKRRRL